MRLLRLLCPAGDPLRALRVAVLGDVEGANLIAILGVRVQCFSQSSWYGSWSGLMTQGGLGGTFARHFQAGGPRQLVPSQLTTMQPGAVPRSRRPLASRSSAAAGAAPARSSRPTPRPRAVQLLSLSPTRPVGPGSRVIGEAPQDVGHVTVCSTGGQHVHHGPATSRSLHSTIFPLQWRVISALREKSLLISSRVAALVATRRRGRGSQVRIRHCGRAPRDGSAAVRARGSMPTRPWRRSAAAGRTASSPRCSRRATDPARRRGRGHRRLVPDQTELVRFAREAVGQRC